MKVTICFDDVKVIVPCGNGNNNNNTNNNNKQNDQQNDRLKVIDVIQNSIAKYKKATDKPNNCIINVLKLQTVRDGGILDPDDYIQEVVEDKELLVAIYQEYYPNTNVNMLDLNKQSNSLNNSSISSASSSSSSSSSSSCSASANVAPCNVAGTLTSATATAAAAVTSTTPYFVNVNNPHTSSKYQDCKNYLLKNHVIVTQQDFNTAKGYLKVKSGSESCIYKTNDTTQTTTSRNRNDYINSVKLNSVNQQQANRPNSQHQHHHHHHHNHNHRDHMGIMKTNTHLSKSPIIVDDALLIGTENTVNGVELTTKSAGGYFSRVNSNRQSIVKNENLMWSNANSYTPVYTYNNNTTPVQTNNVNLSSASANNELFSIVLITNQQNQNSPLGIHVIPTFDSETQRPMGLVIQRIEPNGRIHKDGRLKAGDRIVEINKTSLIGVDFLKSQQILREAIKYSGMVDHGQLELKIVRSLATLSNMEQQQNQQQLLSSPTCSSSTTTNELSHNDSHSHDQQQTTENKENDENAQTANDESNEINDAYVNNNPLAINMSALNTKKIGKKITIQLIKGPQGLGFKLAARDNCAPGEFSPIYIKNILPKGAAITDGRLQRGDRLLEVNKLDMTQRTLHEAVNILRNTKLGSVVELIVSRQLLPHQTSNITSTGINAAQLPRELNEHQSNGLGAEEGDEERQIIDPDEPTINDPVPEQAKKKQATKKQSANNNNNRRQLLTFEIPLNETGSAGLGVSVKGKTKRLEENDCSIDLGIFIKTVINGGAASKDGRLRPNDQLININGFSLLGKSNEEAMLILREAMMVESKPGHIELTVSRKVKQTTLSKSNNTTDSTQMPNAANEEQRQVVKIIHHNSTSDNGKPTDEHEINNIDDEDEEDTSVHVPITTSTSTSTGNSRFNRDAPNRRSMSEKRVKIGAVPAHFSQSITTSSGLNKFQQRMNEKQHHKQQIEPTVPKRSHTVNIIHTLNKQQIHHQQTQPQPQPQPQQQPQRITIHKNYASMLRQPVELKIKNEFIVEPEPDNLNDDTDSLNRVGSFESLVNHRNSEVEKTNAMSNQTNYTLIKPMDVKHHSTGGYYSSRKSASMESIPQQNDLLNVRQPTTSAEPPNSNSDRTTANFNNNNNNHTNNNGHVVVNVHNKYGTIGGYSLNSNHKTNRPSILTNSSTNPTLNNTTSNSSNSNQINVNSNNNNNNNNKNQVGTSTATSATNGIVPGSVEAMQSTSNSRLRAINRSFRTAVDKSFDVSNAANITAAANTTENADDNVNSSKSDEVTRKAADNKHAKSSSTSTNATSHKGLIGKFQNLFKSSAPAQTSSSKKQTVVVLASSKPEPNLATTTTANVSPAIDTSNQPSTANPNPKSTVELLNFQKKHFDSPNYNYDSNVQKLNPTLSANVTTHNQNVKQKAGKFDNQQILIENNTLYTQYRPQQQQQQQQVDVENGISTSSSSSSSVIPLNSSSSPSSSLSMTANRNDDLTRRTLTTRTQFTSNRRESLFYHSSDNYRMVYNQQRQQYLYEQQQHLLKEQQRKFLQQQKKLNQLHEQQQQQQQQQQLVDQHSHQSRILSKANNVGSLTNRPYSAMSNQIEQLYSNSNVKSKTANNQPVKQTPVMHSMPFNAGSNQVHSISDIFKDEPPGKTTPVGTYFDRLHVNQLSTKSQPPMSTYDYQKEILLRNHGHNQTESTSTVSSSSSTASTSSASSSISSVDNALTRHQFNFAQHQPFARNVTNMTGKLTTVTTGRPVNKLNTANNVNYSSTVILPHPAQV